MSGEVQFDEENQNSYKPTGMSEQSLGAIEGLVIKTGVVSDAKGAQTVLIIIAVIFFAIAGFVLYKAVAPPSPQPIPQNVLNAMSHGTPVPGATPTP